nr:hypothetical protein [uncultured Cohaesibacter sp.]
MKTKKISNETKKNSYTHHPVFDLLSKRETFGLDKFCDLNTILQKLGSPDEGWEDDSLMCYDDLEIGICNKSTSPKPVYFAIYPEKNEEKKLIIPNTYKNVPDNSSRIKNFVEFFFSNNIGFAYDPTKDYDINQKYLVTSHGDELFFQKKSDMDFYLYSIYFSSL